MSAFDHVRAAVLAARRASIPSPEAPPPAGPGYTSVGFSEDTTTDFPNPERGWYVEDKYWGAAFGTKVHPSPVSGVMSENRPTLELYYVNLRDFLYTDTLSTAFLNAMEANYQEARLSGVKLVVRHAYNRSGSSSPEDVSISRMKAHIDQLAPYWAAYQDVIACLQAGFVGPWGEMWRSDYITTTGLRQELIQHLMANTPSSMMVQWRDPGVWTMYEYATGATYADRFTGTAVQRAGHYNDSFANGYEMVTYWDGNWTTEQQMAYVASIGPHTAMGGESSQDVGSPLGQYSDGDYIIPIMESWGWDYLNSEYAPLIIGKWNTSGHLAEISRRLGYRLALESAVLPTTLAPGQSITVSFTMKNSGFGKVYNPRPIDLVFVGQGGPFTVRLTSDARRDLPLGGETATMGYTVNAPAGLVPGETYALHLRLPDPSGNLSSDNRYSIRLANSGGIWDGGSGRHDLGVTASVTS